MIQFSNLNQEKPFLIFEDKYNEAIGKGQKNIEAISISSYNKDINEIESRFVNLKFIVKDEFIFFSNYNSPKASSFKSHSQIAALLYWPLINLQIRMKAKIKKTSSEFNQKYFFERSEKKNALSISSNQSQPISSYEQVIVNYNKSLKDDDLKKCPDYWGGFSFKPYEIEFWEGNQFRLNRRDLYSKIDNRWSHIILEP
tara:strand:+ start:195 stop:791 length:597 start_codon:yes stop_codon:yes gene_type:complete